MKLTKRQKGIFTWVLAWAGLLIVVLYSPLGSPGLYTSQNYYVNNQPVSVQNQPIQNISKTKSTSDNNDYGLDIPDISQGTKSNNSAGNYSSTNYLSQGSSYGGSMYQSYPHNINNSPGGISAGGTSIIASTASHNSAGTSGIVMTNSLNAMSTTSDLNTQNKQAVTTGTTSTLGGTDPGGDPTGGPIPVGDGWGLLVLFGVVYAFVKREMTPSP